MMTNGSVLGIDLGGTKIALALYDHDFQTIDARVIPTGADRGFDFVMKTVTQEASSMIRPDTRAIGLGVPGFIHPATGEVRSMPNIPGAEGTKPATILSEALKLPVTIENDARCFAYAEAMLGAGKGHKVVLGVTLGTGVGGGIVIDGVLYHGANGIAGEIGHSLLKPGEPPYPTDDRRGDAEQFLSGTAMGKRCEAASRPEDYLEGTVCSFMQPQVFREIAWLVTNAVHFVDPSLVVFGGSAGRALSPHLDTVRKELSHWMLPSIPVPNLAIGVLQDPSRRGAALLASKNLVH